MSVTSPSTTPSDVPRSFETPMVGRATEFAELIKKWERVRRGAAEVVILEGVAGVGKTRLLSEFHRWATVQGADVMHAHVWNSGNSLPYQPIVDALRPRLEAERAPDDLLSDVWLVELSRLQPELRDRYPDLELPSIDGSDGQGRLFEAVARSLHALATRTPVLLIMDDMQSADTGTRELLHYVFRRAQQTKTPLLLMLGVRSEVSLSSANASRGLAEWLGLMRRDQHAHSVQLAPLSAADMLGLVVALTPEPMSGDRVAHPPSPEYMVRFSQWLFHATNGHPGGIADALMVLYQQQLLTWEAPDGAWVLDVAGALHNLPQSAPTHTQEPWGATPSVQPTSQPVAPAPALSDEAPHAALLRTKLYVPQPRPELVPRSRLLGYLSAGLRRKLTVVTAPAGFGKTTLLSAWLAEQFGLHSTQVAWVSLDAADNDPTRFWMHLTTALDAFAPGSGGPSMSLLQSPQPPPMEALLSHLLNDLLALAADSVIVLDDYHVIKTPAIHTALTFLLDHLPPRLHLVLASRSEPPLPLARLRARGELCELRTADLRFTTGEATTFLQQSVNASLSAHDVDVLEARTEGWVARLQLAALAMRDRSNIDGCIRAFAQDTPGSHRFVVDYLVKEVLVREPTHIQHFLLQTAILDRMSGPLCDAVLLGVGADSSAGSAYVEAYSQAILEDLERANVFTFALDDERRWYRYHHLFGEVLRARLHRTASETEIATLHRHASAWYAREGLVHEAIRHVVAGGAWEDVIRLIEQEVFLLMLQGQLETTMASLHQARGKIADALSILDEFDTLATKQGYLPLLTRSAAARARIHLTLGDLGAALEWAERSGLDAHAATDYPREAEFLTLACVQIHDGKSADALPLLERWLAHAEASGRMSSIVEIMMLQALAQRAAGNLPAAFATLTRTLDSLRQRATCASSRTRANPWPICLRSG